MGYVKISDPNIIDLNAIHNIINVVNQHSDTLNTLTNNFGATNSTTINYNATEMQHLFDSGSQMIIYGRSTFDYSLTPQVNTSPAGKIYRKTVTFADSTTGIPSFATGTPMIFLTVHTGNTPSSGTLSYAHPDATVNVFDPTSTSFKIRMFLTNPITTNQKIYVNWMAIGPKNK